MIHILPGTSAATIQSSLNIHGHIRFMPGTHVLDAPIDITSGKEVEGACDATIICSSDYFANVTGSHIKIHDLRIYGAASDRVAGTCFNFIGSHISKLWIQRVDVWRFEFAIDDFSMTGKSSLWHIDDFYSYYSKVRMKNAFGMCFWHRGAFVTTGEWPDANEDHFSGAHVEIFNNSGMNFDHCHVQGNGDLDNPNWVVGYRFVNSAAVEMNHSMADTVPGFGIAATGCRWLRLNQCKAGLCKNNAVWIDNCDRVTINGLNVSGRKNRGIPSIPNVPNIYIGPNTQYVMSDLMSTFGTGLDSIAPSLTVPPAEQNG